LVRDPPARGRGRHAIRPGAARSRQPGDDPAVHARLPGAVAGGLPAEPSEGMMVRATKAAAPVSEELMDLWREFKATASPTARERLILHYAPLVKYVAGRVATGLPATV